MSVAAASPQGTRWGRRRMGPHIGGTDGGHNVRRQTIADKWHALTIFCESMPKTQSPSRQAALRILVSMNVDFCVDRHMAAWSSGMILA